MKIQKIFILLSLFSLLGLSVSCSDRYEEGFAQGKAQGYDEGYADGHVDGTEDGFQEAKAYFASPEYKEGYATGEADGYASGRVVGYAQGDAQGYARGLGAGYDDGFDDGVDVTYGAGYNDGYASGRVAGYNARGALERQGYNDGFRDGEDDGLDTGYNMGYNDGEADGYDMGYDDGMTDGYDVGYDDGYYDGSFSVGKTKSLKGYANILSMAHNDIFDYSKIKSPKSTSRGLVANGRLLFEETSLTAKDTLKRAAIAEQYLVVEMAKQVKGKFGLSVERSLKIAKASNHFRKYSTTRALTAEDTNAYASEIIGVDLKSMESAFDDSRRGDLSSMQSVLEKAAEKNGTTPERMGAIVSDLFI